MMELRCERTIHAEVDARGVEWKLCRDCSRARSKGGIRRKVYHRWDWKQWPPERLKDVTYNDRQSVDL